MEYGLLVSIISHLFILCTCTPTRYKATESNYTQPLYKLTSCKEQTHESSGLWAFMVTECIFSHQSINHLCFYCYSLIAAADHWYGIKKGVGLLRDISARIGLCFTWNSPDAQNTEFRYLHVWCLRFWVIATAEQPEYLKVALSSYTEVLHELLQSLPILEYWGQGAWYAETMCDDCFCGYIIMPCYSSSNASFQWKMEGTREGDVQL